MKSLLCVFILLLVAGLAACHKQPVPAQADMDAATRQKAVEIREAADKETAAGNEGAALKQTEAREAPAPPK